MTFSIGEKLELRKNVPTIDKISLLARPQYGYRYSADSLLYGEQFGATLDYFSIEFSLAHAGGLDRMTLLIKRMSY